MSFGQKYLTKYEALALGFDTHNELNFQEYKKFEDLVDMEYSKILDEDQLKSKINVFLSHQKPEDYVARFNLLQKQHPYLENLINAHVRSEILMYQEFMKTMQNLKVKLKQIKNPKPIYTDMLKQVNDFIGSSS